MSARYTRDAINDLDQISSYLAKHDPAVAGALLDAVELIVARLARFPRSAQATEMRGVRAAPVQRYPYIVFYTVDGATSRFITFAMLPG